MASKISAILFDCDNTLVLSEELAFEGCADLINEICAAKQVPLTEQFTGDTLMSDFVGQNFRGMMTTLQAQYGFEMTPAELDDYVRREEDVVIAKLKEKLVACPGVDDQLRVLAEEREKAGEGPTLAVVSSSALRRVQASIDKVGQAHYFGERVFSAATSLPVPTSKPDPAIYLHAMRVIAKTPDQCVAIEDSRSGTLSATRAGIKVIGYVGPYPPHDRARMEKTLTEAGAVVLMQDWSEFRACLAKIESGSV